MEESSASARLAGRVQDLAHEVVSALRSGGHSGVVCHPAGIDGHDDLSLAAVRVLGADVLLPSVLFRCSPDASDVSVVRQAVAAFPPAASGSAASAWSHWAMTRTLHRLSPDVPLTDPDGRPEVAPAEGTEPETQWLEDAAWQPFTHQLAVLAALAVPGGDSGVARAATRRPADLSRGFVRAVRRRDWLQAAGAGRWLALLERVPPTLGLASGLEFVSQMGGQDPRVALHVHAAQLLGAGARV
ncbi:hypothetical protein [Streptomyces sp. NPDC058045]|uniref:hypothetical protein n=1 Tax=Streptomyces sp. NPDC058045 TaxID=3346311 RepID=UPI0036E0A98D